MTSSVTTLSDPNHQINMETFARDIESLKYSPIIVREHFEKEKWRIGDANALGMLAFATGVFLASCYGVHARGVNTPNVILGVLLFFSGICQFISGIAAIVLGDRFGATVFPSYGAFNLAYALIYLPGSGILDAYTMPATSATGAVTTTPQLRDEFNQAMAIWLWAWFILSAIFLVGSFGRDWVCISCFVVLCSDFACQAFGLMFGVERLVVAGNGLGFGVAFLAYYTGASIFWGTAAAPIYVSTFPTRWHPRSP